MKKYISRFLLPLNLILLLILSACGATITAPSENTNKVHVSVAENFSKFSPAESTLATLRHDSYEKKPLKMDTTYKLELDINAANLIVEYWDKDYIEVYYSPENPHKLITISVNKNNIFLGDELTAKRAEGYIFLRVPRNVEMDKRIVRIGVLENRIK